MADSNQTILEKIKGFIGHIAWHIFLWSIDMTEEEYHYNVHIGCDQDIGKTMTNVMGKLMKDIKEISEEINKELKFQKKET